MQKQKNSAQQAKSLFKQSLPCMTVFFFFSAGEKKMCDEGRRSKRDAVYRYRYVSIYVYSLHPLKKNISCTFFTVCSHISSSVLVLA